MAFARNARRVNLAATDVPPVRTPAEQSEDWVFVPEPASSSRSSALPDGSLPVQDQEIPSRLGNFSLIAEERLEFAPDIMVAKWESEVTGLKVVWAGVPGPLVQGSFQVVTEIWDDSGRPHTLEHLCFMGSEQYDYNGVLDLVGNRMLGNGTNAFTADNNTVYQASTVSEEGFLRLLPVFVDHILYPTITQAKFLTEIYSVNEKGEDSGVVLSEMQGTENSSESLLQLRLQRLLYNQDNGYHSETGGLMEALRKLKVDDIRDYHATAYVPQNLTLIVLGRSVSPSNLLSTLQSRIEPSLITHNQNLGPHPRDWKRPFVESRTAQNPPTIGQSRTEVVLYPEKDESVGQVTISWIGPRQRDYVRMTALALLATYLTDSAVSPLSTIFIEVADPQCTDITFSTSSADPPILTTTLSAVPFSKLQALPEQFKSELGKIARGRFDMVRMANVVKRAKLGLQEGIETAPWSYLSQGILNDALFGADDGSDLLYALGDMSFCRTRASWSSTNWAELLDQYFVSAPSITLIGQPSAEMSTQIEKTDKARIADNVATLGPAGLAKLGQKLDAAKRENARPAPPDLIRRFKVPDLGGIDWFEIESARSGVATDLEGPRNRVQEHIDDDVAELPLFLQFEHIESKFIEINIVLSASPDLSADVLALLPAYVDTFFTLPLTRTDGTKLSYEGVVETLGLHLLSYSIGVASSIVFCVKVVRKNYAIAVELMADLLWGSHYTIDRLTKVTIQALQDLPGEKQGGMGVPAAGLQALLTSAGSTKMAMNLMNRAVWTPAFLKRLRSDPDSVLKDFETLRRGLTDPRGMRVCVQGDILSLVKPASTWLTHFEQLPLFTPSELIPVVRGKDILSALGKAPSYKMIIYELSSIESTFGLFATNAPIDWRDPDVPALSVALAALNATEGFLWNAIRGGGLAYGASIAHNMQYGHLQFEIFKSPDAFAAFGAAKKLVDSILAGAVPLTELHLEGAKSTLAYDTAASQATMSDAARASFVNQVLLDRPQDYGRVALAAVTDVTVRDVLRVIRKYVKPLFDPATSVGTISCGPAKVADLAEDFRRWGYDVELATFG